MLIYNVTINVDESIHDEWLQWMNSKHIPDVLATKKFSNALLTRVLVEEELGGITYSIQYTSPNKETLQSYYDEDAPRLRADLKPYEGKFVAFRTELEIVSQLSGEHY